MRHSWRRMAGIAALCGGLAAGCSGDVPHRLVADEEFQSRVTGAIAANPDLAGRVVDSLLAGDMHAVVMDRVLAHGAAVQELMQRIAQDQTMLDGVVNLAVQDSTMRAHVLTLFRGMQMMRGQ